ncbi:hypothetical protein K7432_005303 [Basidiobolus ranarum]|uniref:PAP-associated domain-containing protein n=1 Tax=Basidiobolus ranarum TaxID=34480 RepID=A0ABR2WWU1_9FUNG
MKEWIQRRKINQASQDGGTLNSFCYTLMFIAFMQIKHGLPSLQRLCCVPHISTTLTGVKPTTTCLSCRNPLPQEPSWFFEDIHELKKVYQSDKDTIAELFLGFLRFYAFELNYIQQVVSVRVGALITREEKGWPVDLSCTNTQLIKLLCVEDPFDLSRNVATSAKTWVVEGIRWEFERAVREFKTNGLAGLLEKYISPRDITEFMHQYPWSLNNDEKPLRGSSGCL